jgi:predicted chitinase
MTEWTISPEALRHVCPNLDRATAAKIAKGLGEAFARYDIDTPARAAMAVAQWGHECDHFRTSEEYASGAAYEGRKDLGNTHPGDGKRFKGRGRIQITGRANYVAMAKALGIDCVNKPQLLSKSPYSELASGQWWKDHGCNRYCDRGDFIGLTRRINGGTNGLADRQRLLHLARAVASDLVPRDRMAVLTDSEREQIEILATERKSASRNGGWEKLDPSHLARATKAKQWLVARAVDIKKLAEAEPRGWSKGGRQARYTFIKKAITG